MWHTPSGANRRGYQPFGSASRVPYGSYGYPQGNPYGSSPYGFSGQMPYGRLQGVPARKAPGRPAAYPYGNSSRTPQGTRVPQGNPNNSRQNARVANAWSPFGVNTQQRDGADVPRMKGFKKAEETAAEKLDGIKDKIEDKVDALKEDAAQKKAQVKAQASAGDSAQDGSTTSSKTATEAGVKKGVGTKAEKDAVGATSDKHKDEKSAADHIIEEAEAVIDNAGQAEVEASDLEMDAMRQEVAEWKDRYMRLHADWDTYRRRTTEQRAEEKMRANEKLIEDLLPVLDDFERTVDYANENGEAGLLDGVKAVQNKLIDALKKDGLIVLDPVGEPYDALEAQVVATVPDTDAYDETVKDVYQKGYKLGNKVIRPAMVTVTTGGPARPKDEEDKED